MPNASSKASPKGRKPGSVALTPEMQIQILTYIEAGAFDHVAADAAGIDARTLRDWMSRGEGRHPTRRRTPQLERFAAEVRQAKARARAAREIVIAERDPKFWLQHVGRSRPGLEGWTEPVPDAPEAQGSAGAHRPTIAEAAQTLRILIATGQLDIEPCRDPSCRCGHHAGGGTDG